MRTLLSLIVCLSIGCSARAQVATMGSTSMSLPTVPGAIVTAPLNSPGPFSATTLSGTADTTLAPVPLASNPAMPGTYVTCGTPSPLLLAGAAVPTVTATGTTPSALSTSSSFSTPAGSSTGTVSSSLVGASQTTVCSNIPGGPATPASSLSLSTPQVPASPPPGSISPDVTAGGDTSLDSGTMPAPTPNGSSCTEGVTMSLSNPGTIAAANATGAAATPGVMPAGQAGC
jgi:hypothetical protein